MDTRAQLAAITRNRGRSTGSSRRSCHLAGLSSSASSEANDWGGVGGGVFVFFWTIVDPEDAEDEEDVIFRGRNETALV